MAATAAPTARSASSQNLQSIATVLWAFIHPKVRRFTSEVALKVIDDVQPRPDEEPKLLAKRLRKALGDVGVSLKHTVALEAASRILGHSSWHARNRERPTPKLKLTILVQALEEQYLNWPELAPKLADWLEAWHQTNVFELRFGSDFILVCLPKPVKAGPESQTEMVQVLAINPFGKAKGWLDEAPAAFEFVRRRLEETNKAILDGVATLQICGRHGPDVLAKLPPHPATRHAGRHM